MRMRNPLRNTWAARAVLRRRRLVVGLGAVLALTGVAACGNGSASSTVDPTDASKVVSLTLGMAAPSAGQPCVFWAQSKGIFAKLGLQLTVSTQGSSEPALAAAGELVIGANTITQAYPPMQAGRKISQVYAQTVGNPSDAITVRAKSSYNNVQDLSGQIVGVVGTSGYSYAGAVLYSRYIVQHGGQPLKIVVQPDQNTLTSQLVNGKIVAAIFPPVFGPQITAGILREILSAKSQLSESLNGKGLINSTFWGLASQISKNSTAVTRLVAGCRIADAQMQNQSAQQIAAVLGKTSTFAPSVITPAALATEIEESWIGFQPPNQGYIPEQGWQTSLSVFASLGITSNGKKYDPADPKFAYSAGVDMSYWNKATPIVNSYLAKNN